MVQKKLGGHGLVKEDNLNIMKRLWGKFKLSPKEHARKSGGGAEGGRQGHSR